VSENIIILFNNIVLPHPLPHNAQAMKCRIFFTLYHSITIHT